MKTIKSLALAGVAVLALASCNKTPVGDAVVSFGSDIYTFNLEDGPNFSVPIEVKGDNITYPLTVTIKDLPATDDAPYSERNVDYRFLEREVVINSAEDKPEFTVRIINSEVEVLYVGLEITAVAGGTGAGEVSTTEILVANAVAWHMGDYDAKGTYVLGDAVNENYTETWQFMNAGTDVGFFGLLGMDESVDPDMWPIMGESIYDEESGMVVMGYPMGVDNYVTAGQFNLPSGPAICLIAPLIVTDEASLALGTLVMGCTDENTIVLDLPKGYGLTFGLFDYETGGFTGYIMGDILYEADNTLVRSGSAAASAAPSLSSKSVASGLGEVGLVELGTGKTLDSAFKIVDVPMKRTNVPADWRR